MRILVVMVRRNELNQQRVDIPPHELPVLAYVHGEEQCRVVGELIVDRDVPDATEEYQRLAQKYGRDKANESLEPRVSAVYGAGTRGVRELEKAIDYGQREDLDAEAFNLLNNEPSHEQPGANVLQKTQHRPMAHTTSKAGGKKKRRAPARDITPQPSKRLGPNLQVQAEGEGAEGVQTLRPAGPPAAMQPGRAQKLHEGTQKAKRAAVAGDAKRAR